MSEDDKDDEVGEIPNFHYAHVEGHSEETLRVLRIAAEEAVRRHEERQNGFGGDFETISVFVDEACELLNGEHSPLYVDYLKLISTVGRPNGVMLSMRTTVTEMRRTAAALARGRRDWRAPWPNLTDDQARATCAEILREIDSRRGSRTGPKSKEES